jgi:hypothetical protein
MSIAEYKVSKILFIRGVFIKDCIPIDEIFEQQIIEQLNMENPPIMYDKIPTTFTNLRTWVKKTNIKCWYCDLNFDNMPIFIPKLIENTGTPDTYNISTFGCFCSFCCAMSFNNIHNHKICMNIQVKEMLLFLYRIFNNVVIDEVLASPDRYEMKQYGGDTDSMTYRNKINKLKKKMSELATHT